MKKSKILLVIGIAILLISATTLFLNKNQESQQQIPLKHFAQEGIGFEVDYPEAINPIVSWQNYGSAYNEKEFSHVSFGKELFVRIGPASRSLDDMITDPGLGATFVKKTLIDGYDAAIFTSGSKDTTFSQYPYEVYFTAHSYAYSITVNTQLGEQILKSFKVRK